jgi:hypothetical protein
MVRPHGPCFKNHYVSLDLSPRCPHSRFQIRRSIFRRSTSPGEAGATGQFTIAVDCDGLREPARNDLVPNVPPAGSMSSPPRSSVREEFNRAVRPDSVPSALRLNFGKFAVIGELGRSGFNSAELLFQPLKLLFRQILQAHEMVARSFQCTN